MSPPPLPEVADGGAPMVLSHPRAGSARAITAIAGALVATRREVGIGITKPLPLVQT